MATQVFQRTRLAEQFTQRILEDRIGSSAASGLFLAAPRRTGKSTFLRKDLRPQLEKAGALVIYVDLWDDKDADPGDVIVSAVRETLAKYEGVVTRLARAAGIEKLNVGGMAFSLDRIGMGQSVSIRAALAELSDEVKRPIVLIIDEAQHAITTEKGYNALYALKAARDELNDGGHHGLRIVATGSNQDKLAMLRNSKDQAFFGAPLVPFPSLGRDYVEWFCNGVGLPAQLNPEAVEGLFHRAGRRPEILNAATDALRFDFELKPKDVPARFAAAVDEQIKAAEMQTLRVIHALTPLQSTVLRVLAAQKEDFAPFENATMLTYAKVLAEISPDEKLNPDVSNVQQALMALQEKMLIWKERRGVYSLEDSATAELLEQNQLLDVVVDRSGWNNR